MILGRKLPHCACWDMQQRGARAELGRSRLEAATSLSVN